jgi:hypothetical protein
LASCLRRSVFAFLAFTLLLTLPLRAQQSLGTLDGAVTDATGAAIPNSSVALRNEQTGATRSVSSSASGQYTFHDLASGRYTLTVSSAGFGTQELKGVLVQADRTTTLPLALKLGAASESVDVTANPALNATDTTNGYVLDQSTIENIPLATGSFTQMAILSPGAQADLLADTGTNTGLGNQNIYSNGQRSSSNTFTFNNVMANNLFNGNTSSQVTENRAVLNTGENFQSNGTIRTNTSVYDAIGEALPSPPPQTISEERVNTSMYDAQQGATAGAHIDVTTKSGSNTPHGSLYANWETGQLNANPFFNKQYGLPTPDLHRYVLGAELGGPIVKDKLFGYGSYQFTRDHDQLNSADSYYPVSGLTSDRSPAGLQSVVSAAGLPAGTAINPVALFLLQYKLPNGQYLIRDNGGNPGEVSFLGGASTFIADQENGNIDWVISHKDTLSGKYYFQHDPTTSPFSSASIEGFPQKFNSGSQVGSIENTVVFSPHLTWEQKLGFLRMNVQSNTGQPFTAQQEGINLFGSTFAPGINIRNGGNNGHSTVSLGPTSNFSNTGFVQNTFEGSSTLAWVVGRHSMSFGGNYDFTQLNILNRANQVATLSFNSLANFITGSPLRLGLDNSVYFQGAANRYYRSPQIGAFAQDQWRLTNKLVINAGIRFDDDGGLYEKYGNLVNFDPSLYRYSLSSDTITNSGLIVAGNNKLYHTPGASNSTLKNRQWGFGPRIGFNYTATPKLIVRSGFGLYYDRGEFFTNFSPSAGNGFNGPFGVTLQPPFVQPVLATSSSTIQNPFGTAPPTVDTNPADFINNLPNQAALINGANPYLFGSYSANNVLPYTENWSLDFQYQLFPKIVATVGYTGNHGVHQTVPLPFNQPLIATPQSPVNGQTYSYGYNAADSNGNPLTTEQVYTATGGNTDLRTPYIGYDPNSVEWSTLGWSHYNGLLASIQQQSWHGLQYLLSYTWSHSLDASSGFGLFYNGSDPRNLASGYATSDYDRTHVTTLQFDYAIPGFTKSGGLLKTLTSGFGIAGLGVFESGTPYNVYDYSGTVGSLYFSSNDYLTNPVLPLKPGYTARMATTGHSGAFVNPNADTPNYADQALVADAFQYPIVNPGQSGVPPCGVSTAGVPGICDTQESGFASGYRNIFRSDFQKRADISLYKETQLKENLHLRLQAQFFNITNTPSFDAPNNGFTGSDFGNPPNYTALTGNAFAEQNVGVITNPIGSPRQIQFYGALSF